MFKLSFFMKNKKPRSVKVRSQRYFKNTDEPRDNPAHDSSMNDETVLVENSPVMRRNFRGIAKRMRVIKIMRKRKDLSE